MRQWVAMVVSVLAALILAVSALTWWFGLEPDVVIEERLPYAQELSNSLAQVQERTPDVDLRGTFLASGVTPSVAPGAWPCFRGAAHDNVCTDAVALAESWPEAGPPVLWSLDLGEGHSGPAVLNGRVYLLDYDEKAGADSLRCFGLGDGRELWRRSYKIQVKRNHGMSRTVPAVTGRHVVSMGPKCHVLCVDSMTGDFRWGLDLVKEYGTAVPLWYTGQCPLIDGNLAVVAPGGRALVIGVDCDTGKVEWETPNPKGWQMSHATVVPAVIDGQRMYIYAAIGGVAGVSAGPEDRGRLLWETTAWNHAVVAPSPVPLGDGRILLTAGYGAGSLMIRVERNAGSWHVAPVWKLERAVFACEQHTPIWWKGHLFSVLPNDAEELKRQLVCMTPEGKMVWSSGKMQRFGIGPFMIADGKFLVLNDEGVLTLAKGGVGGYAQLAQAKVLNGRDSWGPMAMADGLLMVRDSKRMVCLDLRVRQ